MVYFFGISLNWLNGSGLSGLQSHVLSTLRGPMGSEDAIFLGRLHQMKAGRSRNHLQPRYCRKLITPAEFPATPEKETPKYNCNASRPGKQRERASHGVAYMRIKKDERSDQSRFLRPIFMFGRRHTLVCEPSENPQWNWCQDTSPWRNF